VQVRELEIPDAYEVTPVLHGDDRGMFLEWYRADVLEQAVGHALDLKQANTSVSVRGALRGIHFATVPPGQAKYVTVTHGAALDIVVDLRVGSPMFGKWRSVLLDDVDRRAVYISEGLGHALVSLTDSATVSYLVSATFAPDREFGIDPGDPEIGLVLPDEAKPTMLSPKDAAAPSLEQARAAGLLPTWADCRAYYDTLNQES
jgi:dTDP-4-dehydrorhamnose 3,5-epimerase